jgi:DNA-binding NarL/FixJ family response regulator
MAIRVVVVHHNPLMRSVGTLALAPPDFVVVGEASDGARALELARELRPDLALLDATSPDMGGIELTRAVHRMCPTTRILAFAGRCDRQLVAGILVAGASGYLLRSALADELREAAVLVAAGGTWLNVRWFGRVEGEPVAENEAARSESAADLDERDRLLLRLLADGHEMKELPEFLGVTLKTARKRRQRLMERHGITSAAGLVKLAIRTGVASLGAPAPPSSPTEDAREPHSTTST